MKDWQDPINDPINYKYGFYYNPDDYRVIVPKRIRAFGWTLNFAKPTAYFIILLILAIPFLIQALMN